MTLRDYQNAVAGHLRSIAGHLDPRNQRQDVELQTKKTLPVFGRKGCRFLLDRMIVS